MRISELSRESGVSIPTIKFYLREGLLPPGTPTASNQAQYGDGHVHRLRLVRVLMDVGGLGVAAVRKVLDAIADEALPKHEMLGTAQFALGPVPDAGPVPDDVARARAEVDRFLAERGWRVSPENPSRRTLADALAALWRLAGPAPRARCQVRGSGDRRNSRTARTRRWSSVVGSRSSLPKIAATWVSTVRSERNNRSEMAWLDRPSAISAKTSRSRSVSRSMRVCSGERPTRRAMTSGSMADPPLPTRRTASTNPSRSRTRSLRRYPTPRASSPSSSTTWRVSRCWDRTRTPVEECSRRIRTAAVSPSTE